MGEQFSQGSSLIHASNADSLTNQNIAFSQRSVIWKISNEATYRRRNAFRNDDAGYCLTNIAKRMIRNRSSALRDNNMRISPCKSSSPLLPNTPIANYFS